MMKNVFFLQLILPGVALFFVSANAVEIDKVKQKSIFAEPFLAVAELGEVAGKDPNALRIILEPLNHQSLEKNKELIAKLQATTEVINDNKWVLKLHSSVPQYKKDQDFKLTLMLDGESREYDFNTKTIADVQMKEADVPEPSEPILAAVPLDLVVDSTGISSASASASSADLPDETAKEKPLDQSPPSPQANIPIVDVISEEDYEVSVGIGAPIVSYAVKPIVTFSKPQPAPAPRIAVADIVVSDKQYVVKKGDSLWKIAGLFDYNTQAERDVFMHMTYQLNKTVFVSENPNQLYPGALLNVPAARDQQTSTLVFVLMHNQFFTQLGAPIFDQAFKKYKK